MSKEIKNFLFLKASNKFSGINKASSRQLSKEKKNLIFIYHMQL